MKAAQLKIGVLRLSCWGAGGRRQEAGGRREEEEEVFLQI